MVRIGHMHISSQLFTIVFLPHFLDRLTVSWIYPQKIKSSHWLRGTAHGLTYHNTYLPLQVGVPSIFHQEIRKLEVTLQYHNEALGEPKIDRDLRTPNTYTHTKFHYNPSSGSKVILTRVRKHRQTHRQTQNSTSIFHGGNYKTP